MATKKQRSLRKKNQSAEAEENDVAGVSKTTEVLEPPSSDIAQTTVASTDSKQRKSGAARSVCAMHKVVIKKAQGKKLKITCDALGVPQGDNRKMLQSYIGMLARTMVPINIEKWPEVSSELKEKIWLDVQVYIFSSFISIENIELLAYILI